MMKPVNSSRQLVTRREALAAGGAGLAAALLPEAVHGQQSTRSRMDLQAILSRMTLADKVGQLLMAYLEPTTLEEKIVRYRCGSLLVWGNLKNLDALGLCDLTNRAQALSLARRRLPLWLHGYSQGLGHRMGWLGHAAKTSTPAAAERAAEIFGRRWRAVGLHNLPEPTLNVPLYKTGIQMEWNTATGPKTVREFGLAVVRGATRARCGTMAQHFPAHGATPLDSHNAYPVVELDRQTLMRDHLEMYRECFQAGCTTICTAHLACPALDPDPRHIATTSRLILTDFLRGKLGFQGVTIADAIGMKGFQKNGPAEEISVDAVIAGCDCICVTNEGTDMLGKVFDRLMKAAQSKRLTSPRLDEAVLRNLKFMEWLGLLGKDARVSPDRARQLLSDEQDNRFLARIVGAAS
jgi:beta-glucosidase-like glycosyl hydrolase